MKKELSQSIRHELITLARRSQARVTEFHSDRPVDWRPRGVKNPDGMVNDYFTDASAWEFIAAKLEEGHFVEIITLRKPEGATGYVMKVKIEVDKPLLYIKLQLGSGKIIGRSFHYSEFKHKGAFK